MPLVGGSAARAVTSGASRFASALGSVGSFLSGIGGFSARHEARRESARNREFQAYMSNTAIRRRMEDMRLAGINPILAARFDASTPGGAMANMENIGQQMVEGGATMASTALSAKRLQKELELMDAQIFKTYEEGGLSYDRRQLTKVLESKGIQETLNLHTAGEIAKIDREIRALQIPGVRAEADFWKWINGAGLSEISKAAGRAGPLLAPMLRIFLMLGKVKVK